MIRAADPTRGAKPPDLFFDTATLSNFALAGRVDVIVHRYGSRAVVTPEVLNEITDGAVMGYPALREVELAVEARALGTAGALTTEERKIYRALLASLSAGEASCIACAMVRRGTVVTDDKAARTACGDRGVPVTGTIGILKGCVQDGSLAAAEADLILEAMIDAGYLMMGHVIS